jgi:cytoskeletal protein CcmA (bactofilin family)
MDVMSVGKSVVITGELRGGEDLVVNGRVDGKIDLPLHTLTIGAEAHIQAEIVAKSVVVLGSITGRVSAHERFEIRSGGAMEGQLTTPKLAMADGALFNGTIDMPARATNAAPPATVIAGEKTKPA